MRQHKYRAWDKITKQICPVWAIAWKAWDDPITINYVTIETDGTVDLLGIEVELMQFTGLLDKNDKEIYEGDILKTCNNKNAVVDFINGCFVLLGDENRELLCTACSYEEIIGNIHENPELVETK